MFAVYRLAKGLGFLDPPWNPEHEQRRTIVAAIYALLLFLCVFLFGYANAWPRVWAMFGIVNAAALLFFLALGAVAARKLWKMRHPAPAEPPAALAGGIARTSPAGSPSSDPSSHPATRQTRPMTAASRVVFFGTPDFAAASLAALLDAGFDVPLVVTQPDRPVGRHAVPRPSAVARARGRPRDSGGETRKGPRQRGRSSRGSRRCGPTRSPSWRSAASSRRTS